MSEAGAARRFMFGADGEAQVEVHKRQGVVGMQNNLHAVRELIVFEFDFRLSEKPGAEDRNAARKRGIEEFILPLAFVPMLKPGIAFRRACASLSGWSTNRKLS